jgi:hypothetical protein
MRFDPAAVGRHILVAMVRLRCTSRVLKRFGLEPGPEAGASTTLLGDWYANLLNAGRSRWVLCVSERALLPVIVPARKATFPGSLSSSLRAVLAGLGIPSAEMEREIAEMARMEVGRTRSRQVLGVMNDFAVAAKLFLRDDTGPIEVALRVAHTPSKPLDHESPERIVRSLFASHRAS